MGAAKLWQGTAAAARAAVDSAAQALRLLLKKTEDLLNYLIAQFERGALELLAIVAIVGGVIWFAPEILERVGGAFAYQYGKVGAGAPGRIAKAGKEGYSEGGNER